MYRHGFLPLLGDFAHGDVGRKLLAPELLEKLVELADDVVLLLAKERAALCSQIHKSNSCRARQREIVPACEGKCQLCGA